MKKTFSLNHLLATFLSFLLLSPLVYLINRYVPQLKSDLPLLKTAVMVAVAILLSLLWDVAKETYHSRKEAKNGARE